MNKYFFVAFMGVLALGLIPALNAQNNTPAASPPQATGSQSGLGATQDAAGADQNAPTAQDAAPAAGTEAAQNAVPEGKFRAYYLGMTLDELKRALAQDPFFAFKGDRDVSFLPLTKQNLVESEGLSFVKRAFFQLKDGKVFIMAFSFNTDLIDHYSIYTTLVEKYGEPEFLNPEEAVWETDTIRLSIERPLTVKYIDKIIFNDLVNSSTIEKSVRQELREDFLDEF